MGGALFNYISSQTSKLFTTGSLVLIRYVRGVDGVEVGATDGVTDDLDDGAEEEEDKPTDGEFPGVGGSDGNGSDDETTEGEDGSGNDDGSCSDGRGGEVEVPTKNLSCMALSLSILTTINSWNQP